jgi:hypothetical protein
MIGNYLACGVVERFGAKATVLFNSERLRQGWDED